MDNTSFSYKGAKLKKKTRKTNNFFMMSEVLVGCPSHVAGPDLSYKPPKNRHLNSGKIVCRRASVSCAIELREKIILFISPVNTFNFKAKSKLRIFQKKLI